MDEWASQVTTLWAQTRLDRVATVNARIGWKALTAAEYQEDGYAFLATPNIKSEIIDFANVNYISEFRYNESPELKLRPGDVLLAKDGSTLGIANVVRGLPRPATVNGSVAVLRPFGIEARYLMYVMRGSPVQEWIAQVKDGMGVPHLFQADIKKFSLPLPTPEEQRQIADFLDEQVARIDNIIAARHEQQALIEEGLTARLAELFFIGSTVPMRRLVREAVVGIVVQPARYYVDASCGVPALRGTNVDEGEISTVDLVEISHEGHRIHPRSQLISGDVVVVRTGDAGAACIVPDWAIGWNCIDLVIVRANGATEPQYIEHALNAARRNTAIAAAASGSIQQHFGVGALLDLPVRWRGPDEQRKVVASADEARGYANAGSRVLAESVAMLGELKRSLITAAVTGEFEVSTADGSRVSA